MWHSRSMYGVQKENNKNKFSWLDMSNLQWICQIYSGYLASLTRFLSRFHRFCLIHSYKIKKRKVTILENFKFWLLSVCGM